MNPLGLFLEPLGLFLRTSIPCISYSECLPTRLSPLAEPTCFSQVGTCGRRAARLGETGPLSQGVQARRKPLRIRHMNGMEVRKKRPRGFKKRPRGFK